MTGQFVQIPLPLVNFEEINFSKDVWLVLLHANRIPPHASLLIDGSYSSLTIKGHELNISQGALMKTISKKEIEAVFIKIARHPVFSASHQSDIFMELIKKEEAVTPYGTTCLWPIKLFFEEFYALPLKEGELLFDFIGRLEENKFLDYFSVCNFDQTEDTLTLPFYSAEELNQRIKNERLPFYKN